MSTNFFAAKNATVDVALSDTAGNAILAKGLAASLPSAVAGYAIGCEYIATDTGAHYINVGTASSATFSVQPTAASNVANIRFSGQPTTVGGAAAEAFTVTGVLATDRAFVQIVDNGTSNVTALQAVCTTNTLTVTFSANPGADTIFNYMILRTA